MDLRYRLVSQVRAAQHFDRDEVLVHPRRDAATADGCFVEPWSMAGEDFDLLQSNGATIRRRSGEIIDFGSRSVLPLACSSCL